MKVCTIKRNSTRYFSCLVLPKLIHLPHHLIPLSEKLRALGMRLARDHSLGVNLQESRPSNDVLIREVRARLRQDHVRLSLHASRDLVNLVVATALRDADLDVKFLEAGEEDGVDGRVLGNAHLLCDSKGTGEGHGRAVRFVIVLRALQIQLGKGHEWQLNGAGTAGDEGAGERVDFVEEERRVKGVGEGRLAELGADVAGVASLDGENRAGGGQVVLVHDGGCGSQIGGDTNALENAGQSDEGVDIGDTERVLELDGGRDLSGGEGLDEEADVRLFVDVNFLEVGVKGVGVAGLDEVGLGELGEGFLVEFALQVFEG